MHWKAVAVALCSLPVLTGCGAVRNWTNETRLAHTQRAIEHDLRSEARAAWQTVRAQNDRRAFTDEFYDGFLDGFVDHLDRGGTVQPPAAPPIKYVREKRYYSEQGHCLINDYYLGFKYGAEVASASGRRRFLTVPVALADPDCDPAALPPTVPTVPPKKPKSDDLPSPRPLPEPGNKFTEPNKGDEPPRASTVPPLPKPALPVIKPFNPDLGDDKFAPPAPDPNPDLLPPPYPALPVPVPPDPRPLPVPEPIGPLPPALAPPSSVLPAPPGSVPLLPAGAVVPVTDPVPVVPFRHPAPAGGFTVPWKK